VPLLGDMPFVGGLFRSESRERRRTNLMVFLRPIVLRDADGANRFSLDRYEQLRTRQGQAQPAPSAVLPINEAPTLPSNPKPPMPTVGPEAGAPQPKAP
jgi:general secretion pathway protein D